MGIGSESSAGPSAIEEATPSNAPKARTSAVSALSGQLGLEGKPNDTATGASSDGGTNSSDKKKPKGQRDRRADIPEVCVEVADSVFDELVLNGKAERS